MPVTCADEAWRIRYDCRLREVPQEALAELLLKLRLVADEMATVDRSNTVWPQLRNKELHLEAKGWRFSYSVPHRGLLAVSGAHPIPAPAALRH
ncbi:MAG: hypothetical protein ACXWLR_06635 [Myxococcales bacterium]